MITQEQVSEVINSALEGSDKFLVEVILKPINKITVFIDSDTRVSISDCQKLSRSIESKLDRDFEDYELTVSSAGMDRPIKLLRQYQNRIGKELEIITKEGEKEQGVLIQVTEDSLELDHPVKNQKKEIKKANSIIKRDAIKTAKIIITIGKQE
jgi:ribosome maturation factor RimP